MEVGEQRDVAVEILHQRGATFDPVPAIVVIDPAEGPDDGGMDVAADDAGDVVCFRIANDGFLKCADEGDGAFDVAFDGGA